MPWYNGDYPPSYKNQPKKLRDKAVEIANEVLVDEKKQQLLLTGQFQMPAFLNGSESVTSRLIDETESPEQAMRREVTRKR